MVAGADNVDCDALGTIFERSTGRILTGRGVAMGTVDAGINLIAPPEDNENGILLVYDITSEKSFENIKNWIRNIDEHATGDVKRMILGNKCDMKERRQVAAERGQRLAIEYGLKFMETSAKGNINVEEAFITLASDIKAKMEKNLLRQWGECLEKQPAIKFDASGPETRHIQK